jgi:SPP1 family predicted phage head-tail adaptor
MPTNQDGPIQAGELREIVHLESFTTTRDTLNQPVRAWAPEATVHAKVSVIRGSNVHLANQYQEPTTLEVTIRRGPPITKLWRILWDDGVTGTTRTLAIQDILPLKTRDGMVLLCSEGLTNG